MPRHSKEDYKEEEKLEKRHRRKPEYSSNSESSSDVKQRERSRRKERRSSRSSKKRDEDSSDEDARRKKRKKEKKKHGRGKRKHKREASSSSEDSDNEERRKKKRLLKEAKKFLRESESNVKSLPADFKIDQITEDDYFSKNQEFAAWLSDERKVFFNSLSAEESRQKFHDFVKLWNSRKLSEKYYKGIQKANRTSHNWGFKFTQEEKLLDPLDEEAKQAALKMKDKYERKKERKVREEVLDEILPKATGREALLEKKKAIREAHKAREWSPEPMRESDMMGGGDDFKARLARERAWREKKTQAKTNAFLEKKSAFDERENAAMDQLKAIVDMAGGKITIPKRTD